MSNHNRLVSGHLLLAFLGGAAAGATVAYLTAPRSGAEVRQGIADSVSKRHHEIARLPPALQAAYTAALAAAREAYAESMKQETVSVAASKRPLAVANV